MLKEYIFTFGFGTVYANRYRVVWAKTRDEARDKMFMDFGSNWSMQYESRLAAGVDEYNLTELK